MAYKALFWSFYVSFCTFCAFLWLKNPFNQRNPRLINDLRAYKALYICRETFTDVMSALQIRLFMQNEPKFRKSQMNVNRVLTTDYDKMDTWWSGTKQSQTNPNKAKFKKAKMNVTSILTVGYENKPPIRAPKKQSQTSKRQKPMQTSLPQRIMKITAFSGSGKTNPIKANFKIPPQRVGRTKEWELDCWLSYLFPLQIGLNGAQYSEIYNLIVWLVMKRNYRCLGIRTISHRCFELKGRNNENQRSYQNIDCSDYYLADSIWLVGGGGAKAPQSQ
jgi:hypothetical protein